MSAILEVSSRAGTLLPARYDTVAPSLDSEDDYDVLDRRDNECKLPSFYFITYAVT